MKNKRAEETTIISQEHDDSLIHVNSDGTFDKLRII